MLNINAQYLLSLAAGITLLFLALTIHHTNSSILESMTTISQTNASMASTNSQLAEAVTRFSAGNQYPKDLLEHSNRQLEALVGQQKSIARIEAIQEEMRTQLALYLTADHQNTNVLISGQ